MEKGVPNRQLAEAFRSIIPVMTNVTEVYQSLNNIADKLRRSQNNLPEAEWEQIELRLEDVIEWVTRSARHIPDPSKGATPSSGISGNPHAQKALTTLHSAIDSVRSRSAGLAATLIGTASLEIRGGGVPGP